MQSGAFYYGASQRHGREQCHRRHGSGAPYIINDFVEAGAGGLSGVLVGNSPARAFGGVAQLVLLPQVINFDDDAIGGNR